MLITSYIKKKRPKEALKVYNWMLRPGSPCKVEKIVFCVLVNGLCEIGWVLEGLKVLKDMVSVGFLPIGGLKERVYRSLLSEARVKEAVELDKALCDCFEDVGGEGDKKVIDLLDSLIRNWSDKNSQFHELNLVFVCFDASAEVCISFDCFSEAREDPSSCLNLSRLYHPSLYPVKYPQRITIEDFRSYLNYQLVELPFPKFAGAITKASIWRLSELGMLKRRGKVPPQKGQGRGAVKRNKGK
ncbi:hypothetical protein POTOM_000581 [Populus tomentosa]|uniref:Pentatricopeptide repeat-containing protein n=1 Tax=Populus tomentosa TaxID=118781 RepID=A0A8X8DGC4_POPTO|nr:hypothetical protein POTOM_000581 [Populus tomentosa]